jgi:dCTP deaminase
MGKRVLTPTGRGVLPDFMIRKMIEEGRITDSSSDCINPASLDLRLSSEVYRVAASVRPYHGEKVAELLSQIGATSHDLASPFERGVTYLARLQERFSLYSDAYGWANPKSSTGRQAVHVRVLADGGEMYDRLPYGYDGLLWLSITPRYYPIRASAGERLGQVRIFNADTRMCRAELEACWDYFQLLWRQEAGQRVPVTYEQWRKAGRIDSDGSILLTPWIPAPGQVAGYQCQGSSKILDLKERNIDPRDFYSELKVEKNGWLYLRAGHFYILSTNEAVAIPPELSCEVRDIDSRFGDIRIHIAGFVDAGFGYGHDGTGGGSQITLEVMPYEDVWVRAEDIIAAIKLERMIEVPERHYDQITTSNYRDQWGPRLAKQFAPFPIAV